VTRIAVIGAGIAGLTLAHRLKARAAMTLFDKSYRPGGRLASRMRGGFGFDHGAQYFTIRSDAFRDFLAGPLKRGAVAEWTPRIVTLEVGKKPVEETRDEPIYVGVPGMNALCADMARGFAVTVDTEIAALAREEGGWLLRDAKGSEHGPYDWVVSTAPAPQSQRLLGDGFAHAGSFENARMRGCFALMLGFESDPGLDWQGAFVKDAAVGWMAVEHSKPGRQGFALTVQASGAWSDDHIEDDAATVEAALLGDLEKLTGIEGDAAAHRDLHRWLYAGTAAPAGADYLLDVDAGLAACGDWCIRGRVEAAFRSAEALAMGLLAQV
jgi:renalase